MHLLFFYRGSLLITYQGPKHLAITDRFFFSPYSSNDFLSAAACERHRGSAANVSEFRFYSICSQIDLSEEHAQILTATKILHPCCLRGRKMSLSAWHRLHNTHHKGFAFAFFKGWQGHLHISNEHSTRKQKRRKNGHLHRQADIVQKPFSHLIMTTLAPACRQSTVT